MTKKVLGIITARGGSKGLPDKNILNLAGKPLVSWTIEASIKSKLISTTLVTSDDERILKIARSYKDVIALRRPVELAEDDTPSEPVVEHTLLEMISREEKLDTFALLQPTSPLRDYTDIDSALMLYFNKNAQSLISVNEVDNKILKAFYEEDGFARTISRPEYPFMPRQNLPTTYVSNGAIYIVDSDLFLKYKKFYYEHTVLYKMSNDRSLDIDTEKDLKSAAQSLK